MLYQEAAIAISERYTPSITFVIRLMPNGSSVSVA